MKLDVNKIELVLEYVLDNYEEIRNQDIDCLTLQPVRNLLVDIRKYKNDDFKSKLNDAFNSHGSKIIVIGGSSGSCRTLNNLIFTDGHSLIMSDENRKNLKERGLLLAKERSQVVEEIDKITELFYGPNLPIPKEIIEGKVFSSEYKRDQNIKGQGPKWMKKKQTRDFR